MQLLDLLSDHRQRLRGITSEEDLPHLGRGNLRQISHLLQLTLTRMLVEGADRDELREARGWVTKLQQLSDSAPERPRLPALRVEHFSTGQPVIAYLGDSPGAIEPGWVAGLVVKIEKSHKPEWSHHHDTRGYYWRVTARMDRSVFSEQDALPFSTTEPRVLTPKTLSFLRADPESRFTRIFCENSRRQWDPIWCLERGISSDGEEMDMASWLHEV